MDNHGIAPLAQELLALESETFEIADHEELDHATYGDGCCTSCTSTCSSSSCCS